jgi:hypothetical protein
MTLLLTLALGITFVGLYAWTRMCERAVEAIYGEDKNGGAVNAPGKE